MVVILCAYQITGWKVKRYLRLRPRRIIIIIKVICRINSDRPIIIGPAVNVLPIQETQTDEFPAYPEYLVARMFQVKVRGRTSPAMCRAKTINSMGCIIGE